MAIMTVATPITTTTTYASAAAFHPSLQTPSINEQQVNVFKALEEKCALRAQKFKGGPIVRVKGTRFYTVVEANKKQQLVYMKKEADKQVELNFLANWTTDSIVDKIMAEVDYKRYEENISEQSKQSGKLHIVPKAKSTKRKANIAKGDVQNLLKAVSNICRKSYATVTIIDKRPTELNYCLYKGRTYLHANTKHEIGHVRRKDISVDPWCKVAVHNFIKNTAGATDHHELYFEPGSSGLVLYSKNLYGNVSTSRAGIFIIRGRCGPRLFDSQTTTNMVTMLTMNHYSSDEKFWKSYTNMTQKLKNNVNHKCQSELSVTDCGEVAAIVTQALYPCGRLTCIACRDTYMDLSRDELLKVHGPKLQECIQLLEDKGPEFTHAIRIVKSFERFMQCYNGNVTTFIENKSLIGNRTEIPFKHLNTLNELLMKGGLVDKSELEAGSDAINALIRFQRNRTDNVEKGSLAHFRNKISSKVQINLDLMCDNQLDENGNFAWRQRAYHAKRLLGNFFEVIRPENGYEKYITRLVPDGARKTAIGKLIISTNLETFRQQMQGEPIADMDLTDECTSKIKGSYVYPCCCVTDDHGTPTKSELKIPTKNHLVVGNSGDSKYVIMPKVTDEGMYIAKEGYCHVNIFLAMLINISETQAKDYTKMVRDLVMPKLGKWPTMLDVATLCYMLAVFFPDTQSAELPRILVDHKTKTMHVVDSFGSLSTGYHTLKANTVGQLIKFVNSDLESEMKHYRVGGLGIVDEKEASEDAAVLMLIRGVYRPELLKTVMENDPMLIVYSFLSPGVLLALHSSKSLEVMIQHFVSKDRSVAQLCELLKHLAAKVSRSSFLITQHNIIQDSATEILKQVSAYRGSSPSKHFTLALLNRMIVEKHVNQDMQNLGFVTAQQAGMEMREKKFLIDLQSSWHDLRLSEKLSLIAQSYRSYLNSFALNEVTEKDLSETWTKSLKSSFGSAAQKCKNWYTKGQLVVLKKGWRLAGKIACGAFMPIKFVCPDITKMISVLSASYLLIRVVQAIQEHLVMHKRLKIDETIQREYVNHNRVVNIHELWTQQGGGTEAEFLKHLSVVNPKLVDFFKEYYNTDELVKEQGKSKGELHLERIVAMMALITMIYDAERSDCVYKVLNKIKGIMGTISAEPTQFQGLDDIQDILEEKKLTVDMEIVSDSHQINTMGGMRFEGWWQHQLENGRSIAHYRTEGHFMEFTRTNAPLVAHDIDHKDHRDLMIMGAVGSGKSTGLPFHLSKRGRVLIIEPTRPLAENVHKQLSGEPFRVQATLKMRGHCVFGAAPITIMTSGFALHYYANNVQMLSEYKFIIFDECHVHDASAMAFRCLLHEHVFDGKVIKVSATPPGHKPAFTTQFPVKLKTEETLSFQQFVQAQGTGSNADVLPDGNNILIYVASYNEVDTLSKLLMDKGHKVTKVDGRTMKQGSVEVPTCGTDLKKHFIVATNIIENGVTLDVDVVVDFGLKVTPELDMDSKMIRYNKTPISYGERIQRLGRVGRNKEGTVLKIGYTEVGLTAVPSVTTTEAAFYCFAYGLPVIASGVVVSALANCTVHQAKTMMNFELPIFYTKHFVRYDGTMHAGIHSKLAKFKLRDSETILNKLAIPSQGVKLWYTVEEYSRLGARVTAPDGVKIPFYTKDIPDKLHGDIWEVIQTHQADAGFGRVTSVSACKIAYTLQTDQNSIQRTVCIIDALIANEIKKREHFKNVTSNSCSSSFSFVSVTNAIRARHLTDHTGENIAILQAARNQILEFRNLSLRDPTEVHLRDFGAMECIQFQSQEAVSNQLKLKGHWNSSLLTTDILVAGATLAGGLWMALSYFMAEKEAVELQGSGKRSKQKLKFDKVRNMKHAYEVRADESAEYYFGEAYSKKAPKAGKTRGMGTKTRRFYNMYGFDPTEYSFARYVDPLTGFTLDESPLTDVGLVQEHFGQIRSDMLGRDEIDPQHIMAHPNLKVFFVKDLAKQVLQIDLRPHNPLMVGKNTNSISGHPDREGELRQTGQHVMIDAAELPQRKEFEKAEFEGKASFQGVRDYNSISTSICLLTNDSEGHTTTMHGIGFGPFIITNQHLFRRNNGSLIIQSHKGRYVVKNTTVLQIYPFGMRDMLLIRLPKDFCPFPQKLRFRQPSPGERVCMVGSNFQDKHISSTVSESSLISQKDASNFYRHWITTKDGHCGLPLVSVKDGHLVGIHSMTSLASDSSFFVAFPPDMEQNYLLTDESLKWQQHWKLNIENTNWGPFNIMGNKPDKLFDLKKDIFALFEEGVEFQGDEGWLHKRLHGNLKAVAKTQGQLVTKHVVNGKCLLFATYLETFAEEKSYFLPLMGAYQKSRLNKEAYIKDLFKYSSDIAVGCLDHEKFELAELRVAAMMRRVGFEECDFVTDTNAIFNALNMKAAVGALYQGKKKEYFEKFTHEEKTEIITQSCLRLYTGKMGIWNGSLKAELRAKEKVEQNKTRSFTAAPIDTLLGGKVCVDDFNNQFYELNLKGPWSVGMTKFYGGWDKLLGSLPDGWIYCDADGSQFDSSLTPYLINSVLNLRLKFMEDWDIGRTMLENLYTEIVYTPIATPDGTIIKKFKGNNSGQPSTVVDNTLMVILAMYYSSICYTNTEEIEDYCKFCVNGDDLVIAIRPDMVGFLDTLTDLFAHLGLKYDFSSRHTDKKNLWFMSHKGIEYNGILIPKLEEERIVSILEWDRAHLPEHRLEAICASMIEAWGYPDLLNRIRKFYYWVLEQAPYNLLAKEGKAPYISESALKMLYTSEAASNDELRLYLDSLIYDTVDGDELVKFQGEDSDEEFIDAGGVKTRRKKRPEIITNPEIPNTTNNPVLLDPSEVTKETDKGKEIAKKRDQDVDVGSSGAFTVPRLKAMKSSLTLPKIGGRVVVNLQHLITYEPKQSDLSNTRASHSQFEAWYNAIRAELELSEASMGIVLNGFMVWCIENGTSPNINGKWTMMDDDEQVEYPIKPMVEHAQPTLRQIMAHFSELAEAYIEKRNATQPYMPRYGMQRNLRDRSLARYAFDFYEMTSKTPARAREAHLQMKAAALRNAQTRLFGLDGNVGDKEENTERHTANDVNQNLHNMMGVRF